MVRLVEYRIISGPVIEIRRCRMAVGAQPGRRRAPRKAGASSLKKIMQNEKAAVQRLARIINANFDVLTATLRDGVESVKTTIRKGQK